MVTKALKKKIEEEVKGIKEDVKDTILDTVETSTDLSINKYKIAIKILIEAVKVAISTMQRKDDITRQNNPIKVALSVALQKATDVLIDKKEE